MIFCFFSVKSLKFRTTPFKSSDYRNGKFNLFIITWLCKCAKSVCVHEHLDARMCECMYACVCVCIYVCVCVRVCACVCVRIWPNYAIYHLVAFNLPYVNNNDILNLWVINVDKVHLNTVYQEYVIEYRNFLIFLLLRETNIWNAYMILKCDMTTWYKDVM